MSGTLWRRSFLGLGALALGALGLAPAANATSGTITFMFDPVYTSAGGGEFAIIQCTDPIPPMGGAAAAAGAVIAGSLGSTFCLERDEPLVAGIQYNFVTGLVAMGGGVNTDSGDPLDPRSAYLFTRFYNGILAGYNYQLGSGLRNPSAHALQEALWFIEDEFPTLTLADLLPQAQAWVTE